MIKICKSALEYAVPILKIKGSSVKVEFTFFIIQPSDKFSNEGLGVLEIKKHMRYGLL